jgi:nucleotide-binding universal stress UspA family protein
MLGTVLLHLAGTERDEALVRLAAMLASAHGARLEALHVEPVPDMPVGVLGRGASAAYLSEAEAATERLTRRSERRFKKAVADAGLPAHWSAVQGELADVLARRSRYADLVVIGRQADNDPVEDFIEQGAAPALVVPPDGSFPNTGRHVLIAWDESKEAAHAVRSALPILEKATRIIVLTVGAAEDCVPRGEALGRYLVPHGISAEVRTQPGWSSRAGSAIVGAALELGVDLIVMGAFHHARLGELLLGGTTRHLLDHAPVPLLMGR